MIYVVFDRGRFDIRAKSEKLRLVQQINAPVQSPDILDCPQSFAKYANVSGQTVRNWIRRGIVPTIISAGKIVRFNRAEALAALAGKGDNR